MTDTQLRREAPRPAAGSLADATPLQLVSSLCAALSTAGVSYCHWKSNEALARSMTGDNDLDLLVAGEDRDRFLGVLLRLGFKAASLPHAREVPSVAHWYGLDRVTGRLVHVHAHYRLVLGDDTTKNFRLPLEAAYLRSGTVQGICRVPAPEFELAVLVMRLVLKHATWDALLQGRARLSPSEQRELEWLLARTSWSAAESVIAENLPHLLETWRACREAVRPGAGVGRRVVTAERLMSALACCARRPRLADAALRVTRRPAWALRRRVAPGRPVRKRLDDGGAVIAIVGGDGSGKSTAVDGLASWLARTFEVRQVHLGRPPRSATTVVVKRLLSAGRRAGLFPELAEPTAPPSDPTRPPSLAWLVWHVLTARDRHRLYRRSRRVAASGGVVVCDRYPLEQLRTMDGPRATWARDLPALGRLRTALVDREARYYACFAHPDVLAVLRVHPEVAVARKPEEPEAYVRRRATEVWKAQWDDTTHLIDAAQPAARVLDDLKVAVWAHL